MAAGYYYFVTSLPELSLQDKNLLYNETGFRLELVEFLTQEDIKIIRSLYYIYDIRNFVDLVKHREVKFDPRGNFTNEDLKSGITVPETLPAFMESFVHSTQKSWETSSYHDLLNDLTSRFISWSQKISNPFLHKWFEFDHNLRNILAGLNSRKFNRHIDKEVLGSHFEAEKIIRNKDKDFGLSKVINYVEQVAAYFQEKDISLRESSFDQLRWDFIESLEEDHHFSLEKLMAYALKVRLIERNISADLEEGKEQLNNILKQIKTGYELPEQFA